MSNKQLVRVLLVSMGLLAVVGGGLSSHGVALGAEPGAESGAELAESEIRSRVEAALGERHPSQGKNWWRGLGSQAPRVIISMFEASSNTYHRVRLLEGLGWFGEQREVTDFLRRQAEAGGEDVLKQAAIRGVGETPDAGDEEFVAKFLGDADPQTRLSAAEALKQMKTKAAREKLDEYLSREKTSWIVARLKGEIPAPVRRLAPVSSNEGSAGAARGVEELSPRLAGRWQGFWLTPAPGTGLVARAATVVLSGGATEVEFTVSLAAAPKGAAARKYVAQHAEARGERLSGVFGPGFAGAKVEAGFTGGLRDLAGGVVLQIDLPKAGGMLVLSR